MFTVLVVHVEDTESTASLTWMEASTLLSEEWQRAIGALLPSGLWAASPALGCGSYGSASLGLPLASQA